MNVDSISPGNMKSEDEQRRDICTAGRWTHSRSFVAATDGNISVRLDSRRVLTSPTGISKGMIGGPEHDRTAPERMKATIY